MEEKHFYFHQPMQNTVEPVSLVKRKNGLNSKLHQMNLLFCLSLARIFPTVTPPHRLFSFINPFPIHFNFRT